MMPETAAQWAWFVFYTGGAVGGWALLIGHFVLHRLGK